MSSTNNLIVTDISRDKSAAIKGLLITLVLIGHNHFFVDVFSMPVFSWLYSFHVAIFFVLPFFYPTRGFSWKQIGKNAKRLLWPYSYMFLLFAFICIFFMKTSSLKVGILQTYITGNFYTLKGVVGFQYIWFLPAMFSMMFIKDTYTSAGNITKILLLILGLVFCVVSWVFLFHQPYDIQINRTLSSYSVLSIMLGLGMFFLGVITKWVVSNWRWSMIMPALIMLLTLVAMVLSSGNEIFEWVSRILNPIACMILLSNAKLGGMIFLKKIGELSLPIYLIHQPINMVVCTAAKHLIIAPWMGFIISFIVVLSMSYLLSKLVTRIPFLNAFLFAKK